MRFHSWCPPEAAFRAADELGFYLQPEPGMWNELSPDTPMERMLYAETDRMIKAYGNHPSFMLLSASNEPKGKWKEALTKWVERYRKVDPKFANPEHFRDFCNSTVPLARLRQRIFTTASPFEVDVEIAHYGAKPLENMLVVGESTMSAVK